MSYRTITVKDRFDVIEFEGILIGSASTRKDTDQDRWTEIKIFKTSTGKYVVQKLGCSVRYHLPAEENDEKCSSGTYVQGSDLPEDANPCPKCDPEVPEDEDFDEDFQYQLEVTMSSADVVTEPQDIRKSLVITNKQTGKDFLSSVAYTALQEAVRSDKSLLGVFERRINI